MKGAYLLIFHLQRNTKMIVGALKKIEFKAGYYCYVGSAFGKTATLEGRTARHEKLNQTKDRKKLKWHIDYFNTNAQVKLTQVYAFPSEKRNECLLSSKVAVVGKPIHRFGNTDCHVCDSHFYYLGKNLKKFNGFLLS